MTKAAIVELHYLPCLAWFSLISRFDKVIIDPSDNYSRQTYRNRCRILGANKVEDLIIPVKSISDSLTSHVQIDYQQKWVNHHRRAISSAYGKSPYFEYYGPDILSIYDHRPVFLLDFTRLLLAACLKFLGLSTVLIFDEDFVLSDGHTLDARNLISPKTKSGIIEFYSPVRYFQVFGNQFQENLSIIDLLFCEGPAAKEIIKKSGASIHNLDK